MSQLHHPLGRFCWVDLGARDAHSVEMFYELLFDWFAVPLNTLDGPAYTQFQLGDAAVAGLGQQGRRAVEAGAAPAWNSYIAVHDLAAAVARALQAGGRLLVPPTEVRDDGRLAFLADPDGAVFGVWEAAMHGGFEVQDRAGTASFHELACRDVARAEAFYRAVFGWELRAVDAGDVRYREVFSDGVLQAGMIEMTEAWGDLAPHWMVWFRVDDVAAAAERLVGLGGTLHHGPFDTPRGRVAVVSDPQGAVFTLGSPPTSD